MCGILLLLKTLGVKRENILKQFNKQKHRGPDKTLIQKIDDLIFCFHRLSIINPKNDLAMQPIINNHVVLICNGEIYNYKKLLQNHFNTNKQDTIDIKVDVEIIIHLYYKYGIKKTLDLIDGDFAFILYDANREIIITARDPVGLKPLYFGYHNNEIVAISSEIKSINEYCNRIERHDIGSFYVINKQTHTILEKNKFCDFSEYMTNHKNPRNSLSQMNIEGKLVQYYCDELDESKITSQIKKLLIKSVEKRITHTDQPYAFLCSGGIDSSLILSLAIDCLGVENLHVFSMELEGDRSDDSFYASILTKTYGVQHTIVKFTKEEGTECIEEVISQIESHDLNTIRASIPMYLLAKHIKQNTDYKVILSGEGADELFMGYLYFNYFDDINDANRETLRLIQNLHSFDVLRAERSFSSHGLELRVPFLDKEFIQYVLSLNGSVKLPCIGIEKHILRQSFKDLSKIPPHILNRQKEKFSDGVGFGWVPTLINYCKNKSENVEKNQDNYEKKYYRDIFDKYYKGFENVIIKREMPQKINEYLEKQNNGGKNILSM
jgi:asparagine synthase (glutamine-hydrolysing)